MRIRKHAKLSSLSLSSNSSLSSDNRLFKTHLICQLNQSPWDVITFPPPPLPPPPPPPPPSDSSSLPLSPSYQSLQFDGNESYNGNGSLADSVGAIESVGSMKLVVEVEETDCKVEEREEKRGGVNLCCKTDGKQWHCRREVQKRHTMCDHHLAQIKNYNALAHPPIAKSVSNKPTRARKNTTSTSPSDPNEFYYYSGFGPRWGKKRDTGTTSKITHKREKVAVEPVVTVSVTGPRYSSSSAEIEDDDEDEDGEENCGKEKKRRRKPIKARSLKDLCEGMG